MIHRTWLKAALAVWACAALSLAARAPAASQSRDRTGVSAARILIGVEGTTGSFSVDEENLGMRLVIAEVNAGGGVHGRMLETRGYSRGPAIEDSMANVRREVEEDGVFLIFNHGGPASVGLAAYATSRRVPYLFPHTALITADADRYVFTSYPRYDHETAIMLRHLAGTLKLRRLGLIYADNPYGQYFLERLKAMSGALGYTVAGAQPLADRKPADATALVEPLRRAGADAVILALYPEQAQRVMEAKARLGWRDARMVASGPLTDEQYLSVPGGASEGTIGFCHYPDPQQDRSPGVLEYRRLMEKHFAAHQVNRYSLYGYVFGSLVVEGLRRAGRDLTRERFIDAMETIQAWDSRGILPPIGFSRSNHHAQRAGFVCELKEGRFQPVTSWVTP
jgi:ABC-type branched-subunit amino acid transport system substrate-binding protein